ncbi:calcium-transporting ATPase 8, plasma membrane-type-like [Hordeum vulgare]|nr:calcium-transporting ATPase 8, plasma membrane-type-like [Hordeum vulgare]
MPASALPRGVQAVLVTSGQLRNLDPQLQVPPRLLANTLIAAFFRAAHPRLAIPLLRHIPRRTHPFRPDAFTFPPLIRAAPAHASAAQLHAYATPTRRDFRLVDVSSSYLDGNWNGFDATVFLSEACQDLTLVILIVAAAVSLALGIATEGINEGWYDGASIAFAVFLVILVTAVSDYKQSLQFQHLNEEKQNIQVEVIRGGRRTRVSIFDTVVGDVVALNIGDQVPSDGILISVHSLAIDESIMTGESKIVMKDQKSPFLMGGCKVADGYGTMLVLLVTSKQVDLEYIKEGCIQHW